jgi:hypothetical protein
MSGGASSARAAPHARQACTRSMHERGGARLVSKSGALRERRGMHGGGYEQRVQERGAVDHTDGARGARGE